MAALFFTFALSSPAIAQDFAWVDDLNMQASANLDAFKKELSYRFKVSLGDVDVIIKNTRDAAEAYLSYKLGEMTGRPASYVASARKKNRGKGWGALAKSLGIKPGSQAFKDLKKGHDLYTAASADDTENGKGKGKGKGKNKDKGKKK
mgnify:CR=1 FL=1